MMKKKTKDRANKFIKGSISIMLTVVLSGVLSLSALLVESGRYQMVKKQLDESTINSLMSMLSYYDSDLSKRFGIYGISNDDIKKAEPTFKTYMQFNNDISENAEYNAVSNVSALCSKVSGECEMKYDLANYQVLKRQILEYEKLRAPVNIAEELLDIDKLIKKLKENLTDVVPFLDIILETVNCVFDIADALKVIYGLYKSVEQIQLSINPGDDLINEAFGTGWKFVSEMLSGEDWPVVDPTYQSAYDAFKSSVNEKVNFMKDNNVPPDPGPEPKSNVSAYEQNFKTAESDAKKKEAIYKILKAAEKIGYCDDNGIINPGSEIGDLLKNEVEENDLSELNLNKKNTRKEVFEKINETVNYGSNKWNKTVLEEAVKEAENEKNTANANKNNKQAALNAEKNKISGWKAKKEAYDNYYNKIKELSESIDEKKGSLISSIDGVSPLFTSYREALVSSTEKLRSAAKATDRIMELNENIENIDLEEKKEITSVLNQVIVELEATSTNAPYEGINFLSGQKKELESINGKDIDKSYVFEDHFSTGGMYVPNAYYMTKTSLSGLLTLISNIVIFDEVSETFQIVKSIVKICKLIQPIPILFDLDCSVKLNEDNNKVLPSRINNGEGSKEEGNAEDISSLSAILNDAKNTVNGSYAGSIDSVNPQNRIEESELDTQMSEAIERLGANLGNLMGSRVLDMLILPGPMFFISAVFSIFKFIDSIISIITDLIFVAKNVNVAFDIIISKAGENFLLNQYIIEKFPNRTTDKDGDSSNNEISGWVGMPRTVTPDNSAAVQTFSGAQVEYVLNGSYSEIENQTLIFQTILAIRAILNIGTLLMDSVLMETIAAANVVAPLVFLVFLYVESNIDMNMLLSNAKIHLIKKDAVLSPERLMKNFDHVAKIFEQSIHTEAGKEDQSMYKLDLVAQELLKTDGFIEMTYEDYLWLLLFAIPGKTKTMRTADLIQLEMRYKKYSTDSNFLMKNCFTYLRGETEAELNSIMPVLSLKNNTMNGKGLKSKSIKYVGY